MGLSRLAEQCRKCPFKDNCKNKRMEALGYLPEPIVAEAGASSAAESVSYTHLTLPTT